jgi:hypothetical protein
MKYFFDKNTRVITMYKNEKADCVICGVQNELAYHEIKSPYIFNKIFCCTECASNPLSYLVLHLRDTIKGMKNYGTKIRELAEVMVKDPNG